MKTYKQRTDSILKKAERQKSIRKKVTISAIAATACAALTAFSLVLFTPFKVPENPINAYKNDEYFSVIKPLNAQFEKKSDKPVYKNNFEKWTAELKNLFSSDVKGGASGGELNGAISSDDVAIEGFPEWDVDAPNVGEPGNMGASGNGSVPDIGNEDTDASGNDGYVETTDNQVAGVIEGDLIKRTKTHVFYLCQLQEDGALKGGYPTLRVYSIAGANSQLVCEYKIPSKGADSIAAYPDLYLSQDGKTLTVVTIAVKRGNQRAERFTEIITMDVSNPTSVKELGRKYLKGSYVSSRSVDGKLLIVNNFNVIFMPDFDDYASYIPSYGDDMESMELVDSEDIIVPDKLTSKKHTVVMELDQATGEIEDCMALYCYSADLYVSQSNIFLTREFLSTEDRENMTEITCVSYGDEGFAKVGAVTVEGEILNQYSMDEYNGVLRVVTSVYRPFTSASLYCVDMQTWEIIGSVTEFSPKGEDVQSVRFDKDKAYVCTAIIVTMTDPVYAFNLSDPTNITYKDTGEIKGFSSSLVQFGNGFFLGIGVNGNDSLKIDMYEETENGVEIYATYEPSFDPQNPLTDIEFSTNYKSYFIDRERGLIGLGTWYYDTSIGEVVQQYRLICFDGYAFSEVFVVDLRGLDNWKRACLIEDENGNGWFYMFSAEFKVQQIY